MLLLFGDSTCHVQGVQVLNLFIIKLDYFLPLDSFQKDPRFRSKLVFLEVTQNEVVNFHNMHFWEDKHSV